MTGPVRLRMNRFGSRENFYAMQRSLDCSQMSVPHGLMWFKNVHHGLYLSGVKMVEINIVLPALGESFFPRG
jgi:hypothetical protein